MASLRDTLKLLSSLIVRTLTRIRKLLFTNSASAVSSSMRYRFVVASYTDALHVIEFDPSKAADTALTLLSSTSVGHHPSWVAGHPSDRGLFFSGLEQADGKLLALRYTSESESLRVNDSLSSEGNDPCHFLVTGDQVIVGNYSSATIGIFDLARHASDDLKLGVAQPAIELDGSGPVTERQEKSHPHQIYGVKALGNASISEILIPDLGSDKIWMFKRTTAGKWEKTSEIVLDERHSGGGPRHVVVRDSKLYVILELSSEIVVLSYDPMSTNPPCTILAEAKLPMPSDIGPLTMLGAELLCPEPNTRFPRTLFYASNRNDPRSHGDIISIFAEHQDGEKTLNCVGQVLTGLNHVRAFSFFGPDDCYLIAGGTNGGGIKVFERLNGGIEVHEVAHVRAADGKAGLAPTGFLSV